MKCLMEIALYEAQYCKLAPSGILNTRKEPGGSWSLGDVPPDPQIRDKVAPRVKETLWGPGKATREK